MRESELRHSETLRGRWARPFAVLWFVLSGVAAVDLVAQGSRTDVLRGGGLIAASCVLVYGASFRPAVVIDDAGILLRNLVRDIYVPWPKADDVDRKWVLSVTAEGHRYVAWAVTARNRVRESRASQGEGGLLGGMASRQLRDFVASSAQVHLDDADPGTPAERVLERWMRWRASAPDGPVSVTPQWALGGALAAALIVFAVGFAG